MHASQEPLKPDKISFSFYCHHAVFLLSRASCQRFESIAALRAVSLASKDLKPACLIKRSFSPGGLKKYIPIELLVAIYSCETRPPITSASLNRNRPPGLRTRKTLASTCARCSTWHRTSLEYTASNVSSFSGRGCDTSNC